MKCSFNMINKCLCFLIIKVVCDFPIATDPVQLSYSLVVNVVPSLQVPGIPTVIKSLILRIVSSLTSSHYS